MYERLLIRYGDLILKGRNQNLFIRRANEMVRLKLADLPVSYECKHDRLYVILNGADPQVVIARLHYVMGLYSYSLISKTAIDIDAIAEEAIRIIDLATEKKPTSFKVDTKRADKTFPITSQDFSPMLSGKILTRLPYLSVDVHQPELTLSVEIRTEAAYVYTGSTFGQGGFPFGMSGKALLMISGGIDSPVAGYYAMRKGLEIEAIHFESTPLTPIESVQKVIDILAILAKFTPDETITLHLVPFRELHTMMMSNIPESYLVTIMRRMMYRIATEVSRRRGMFTIVNGESCGQVASQTIESMHVIASVTNQLILRPLVTADKNEIIASARQLGTFPVSIQPFEDCCTLYLPKNPVIRPTESMAHAFEQRIDYPTLVEWAINHTKILVVDANKPFDIASLGLVVGEILP
jgi:thiamine biosynthesis protein ThiI